MQLGVSRKVLSTPQWVHGGALVGVQGDKKLGLFTYGGQINSLKQKKPSKLIFFECKFNTNML